MTKRKTKAPKAKVTYRRVVPRFWNDRDILGVLTLEQKAVLLWTFTNEHGHPCGVYRVKPSWVEEELEITYDAFLELVSGALSRFLTHDDDTEELFVHAMAEHQIDGGLHGQDRRIPWVEKQVAAVRSDTLRIAFASRYQHWNLSRERMDVPDSLPGVENSPTVDPKADLSIHRDRGVSAPKEKGHAEGPSRRGIEKGLTPRGIAKPAAAAATAEGSRTTTSTPSPKPPPSSPDHGNPPAPAAAPGGEGDRSHAQANGADPTAARSTLIRDAEPIARAGLNRMRGRDDEADVWITPVGGDPQRVEYGLDVVRWRELAEGMLSVDPAILARALWHMPEVLNVEPPMTMALVISSPGELSQAIHRALEERPVNAHLVRELAPELVKPMPASAAPTAAETESRERQLKAIEARRGMQL